MKDDYTAVLLENIDSKIDTLAEVMGVLAQDVLGMKPKLEVVAQDVKTLKALQTAQGHELRAMNERLGNVEDYLAMQGMPQRA